jgi:murein DD-endopeptidase MepM/ murein hydrolase activator NlpD
VFSGYWHQSTPAVQVGQTVERGDLIGYVGDTGLVTGAHLHWEMRVGGIAVDPMQWTETTFP